MTTDPNLLKQFEEAGPALMRQRLGEYTGYMKEELVKWLAQKGREERADEEASKVEQMALTREANASAAEANAIARAASDSAKRSADAARTSNRIAMISAAAAIVAMVASIIGSVHSCTHDEATPKASAAQMGRPRTVPPLSGNSQGR